jgi:hypothetical protein
MPAANAVTPSTALPFTLTSVSFSCDLELLCV